MSHATFHTAAPNARGEGHEADAGEGGEQRPPHGRSPPKPMSWVAPTPTMAASHHQAVAGERSRAEAQILGRQQGEATTPARPRPAAGVCQRTAWRIRPRRPELHPGQHRHDQGRAQHDRHGAARQPGAVLPVDGDRVERLAGVDVEERRRQRLDEGEEHRHQHDHRQHRRGAYWPVRPSRRRPDDWPILAAARAQRRRAPGRMLDLVGGARRRCRTARRSWRQRA